SPTPDAEPEPVTIEVVVGDLAQVTRAQREQETIAYWRRELEAHPYNAGARNTLVWHLATAPAILRDADEAVRLGEINIQLAPANPRFRNALGVAHYRAGRYSDAVKTLQPNLTASSDWMLSYDLYFLAMSYHQLGDTVRARDYYDWAVRWTNS